jgi:hypothetical protein
MAISFHILPDQALIILRSFDAIQFHLLPVSLTKLKINKQIKSHGILWELTTLTTKPLKLG